jgi:MSHA biogenesis protein MshG
MPQFEYRGRGNNGKSVSGRVEASSVDVAATQLLSAGIVPITIAETRGGIDFRSLFRSLSQDSRVRLTDLILFSRQMYTLLKAGVPIMQALRGLSESTQNLKLRSVIDQIHSNLDTGLDLTTSFRQHQKIFSSLYTSMIQVGETTGGLQDAFLQLAHYLELEKITRDRIRSAMRYPSFVLIAITIAIAVINIFVVPAFAKVFEGFHAELPWATKVLITTSHFFVHYWPLLVIAIAAAFIGIRHYVTTDRGRYNWDRWKLRLPVVGSIIHRATMGRFARSLAVTVRAGVPLISALEVVSRAVDNEFVERGEAVTRMAAATGMFPPMVLQMISVGEETGAIDELMLEVAEFYEREVEYDLETLSDAIQPILIVAIGGLVFILALGVFLPMWDLGTAAFGKS